MSEAKSFIDASDQESTVASGMKGEIPIDSFDILSCSMTSLHLGLSGTISPGFEVGWVSQVTIRLYHRFNLVGEITCPHEPILPDSDNRVTINWEESKESEMHIKNMIGWKHFFEGFMPKVGTSHEPKDLDWPMAALEVSASGHRLIISIDLAKMDRMTAIVKSLTLSDDALKIVIATDNQSPVTLGFDGDCHFVLEKEQRTIGYVKGQMQIAFDEEILILRGRFFREASGMATLKGSMFESSDKKASWRQYALRLFEVEVNLDKLVIKKKNKGE